MSILDTQAFQWIILPALIFIARILDVSIGTIRIILLSKGLKRLAPVFGFFEILIWLLAVKQVMGNLTNVVCYIAYAGGFAAGTFVGIMIEERLSLGLVLIRIITRKGGEELITFLRSQGYRVTDLDARGDDGDVRIVFSIIKRQDLSHVQEIIRDFNPQAFYSIEDVRFVSEIFALNRADPLGFLFKRGRKGK